MTGSVYSAKRICSQTPEGRHGHERQTISAIPTLIDHEMLKRKIMPSSFASNAVLKLVNCYCYLWSKLLRTYIPNVQPMYKLGNWRSQGGGLTQKRTARTLRTPTPKWHAFPRCSRSVSGGGAKSGSEKWPELPASASRTPFVTRSRMLRPLSRSRSAVRASGFPPTY